MTCQRGRLSSQSRTSGALWVAWLSITRFTSRLAGTCFSTSSRIGANIDYAMLVKVYGEAPGSAGRYSPGECVGAVQRRVEGRPDPTHVSTSFAERANMTLRMGSRRFTRMTNAFSKKVEKHAHSVTIHTMHHNFVRIHKRRAARPRWRQPSTSAFGKWSTG